MYHHHGMMHRNEMRYPFGFRPGFGRPFGYGFGGPLLGFGLPFLGGLAVGSLIAGPRPFYYPPYPYGGFFY